MLDELAGTGLRPAVPVADTGNGANADFRRSLQDRSLAYVLQAKAEITAHSETAEPHQPACGGLTPRPLPRYRARPASLRDHDTSLHSAVAEATIGRCGSAWLNPHITVSGDTRRTGVRTRP